MNYVSTSRTGKSVKPQVTNRTTTTKKFETSSKAHLTSDPLCSTDISVIYRTIGDWDLLPASSVSPSTDLGSGNPTYVELWFIAGIGCRVSGYARRLSYAQLCFSVVVLSSFSTTALVLLDVLM